MTPSLQRLLGVIILSLGAWSALWGQGFDAGKVRVVITGEAVADTTFEAGDLTATIQVNLPEVPDPLDVISRAEGQTTQPGGGMSLSAMGVNLVPGRRYTITASTAHIADWNVQAAAPPGYVVELNGVEATSWPGASSIRIVPQRDAFTGRAGTATSLATGRVHWQVSLGSLENGDSARCLSILDEGRGAGWSDVFTPHGISVQSNEVTLIPDPVTLAPRQIAATEAVVDIVTTSPTSYDLKFYTRDAATAPTGSATLYTFGTNAPFVVYSVSRDGSDTKLKIVRTDNGSTGLPVRTSQTTLERTGTDSTNYVWTLADWHEAGQSVVPVVEVASWTANGTGRLETIVKRDNENRIASTVAKQFQVMPWGEELVATTRGTTNAVTEALTYHVWNAQDIFFPLAIRAKQSGGGNWEAYAYSVGKRGLLKQTFRPYNGSPAAPPAVNDLNSANPATWSTASGEVTTVTYVPGGFNRISNRLTTINGNQVSQATTSFTESATPKGLAYVIATKNEWSTNTPGVATAKTVTKYFREDLSTHLLRNQIWSIENPDGTKHAFAYQKGTLAGTTFSPNATGGATRTAAIKGRTSLAGLTKLDTLILPGETPATLAVAAGELDGVYVVENKSTLEITLRDESARLRRTESHVWTAAGWSLLSATDYTYDYANRLVSRVASSGATYTASYRTAGLNQEKAQLQWEEDETGNRTEYTYDPAGRVATAVKKGTAAIPGDLTTTFTYDADGRITQQVVSGAATGEQLVTTRKYDDAGRLWQETPPGLGTTLYTYDPANRSQTITYPSAATRTETYEIDGRLKSVTGTAVVPEYYTYSVQPATGYRVTRINSGTVTSVRYAESWTDQMGRTVRKSRPGFTGQEDFVESFTFDPANGQLKSQTRTGYAPTLFEYNSLGEVARSGLDVSGVTGALDLNGRDRISDTDTSYERILNDWWLTTVQKTYFANDNPTATVVARTRKRVSGFSGGLREEVRSRDAEGESENTDVVRTVTYNSSARTLTTSTTRPGYEWPETTQSAAGLVYSSVNHAQLEETTTYDPLRRPATVRDPRTGSVTLTYYPGTTLLKTRKDATPDGNTTTYGYDPMGRVTLVRDAANFETRTSYHPLGQVARQWGSGTHPVEFGYDSLGQRVTMTTYQTGTGWSGADWPSTTLGGNTTTWVFDPPSGLIEAKRDAGNVTIHYTYNARGQVDQIISPRTNEAQQQLTSTHTYDEKTGELLGKSYNDGTAALNQADRTPSLTYSYTRTGQLDAVVHGAGTGAAFTHDLIYDPTAPWRVATEDWGSFYGNRLLTHAYETTSAVSTSGGYGAAKLATVRGRANGFTLGVTGNLAQDRAEGIYYSSLGRVAAVTTRAGTTAARDFVYGYTANSSLVSGYSSGSFTQSIQYEPNRDLVSLVNNTWATTAPAEIARFDYLNDPVGRRYGTKQSSNLNPTAGTLGAFADLGGSIFYRYAYNGRGEMVSGAAYLLEQPIPLNADPAPYASSQLPERNFYYAFDHAGNRLAAGRNGPGGSVENYSPNLLNQYQTKQYLGVLVAGSANSTAAVSVSGSSTGVVVGRRGRYWAATAFLPNHTTVAQADLSVSATLASGTSQTSTRTATTRSEQQAFTYDEAGNLLHDGLWDYQWDAANRLVAMTTSAGALNQGLPNQKLSFRYDHLGRRIQKRVQNFTANTDVVRRFLYDGWNLVVEFDATATTCNNPVRSYAWGLDLTGSFTASGGVGALLQITDHQSGTTGLAARDGNGNVVALLNPDPNSAPLAAAYEYSPFGEILRADGPMAKTNPFRFSSKFTDDESALVYYGHRFFSPDLGRFINRDPSEETGGTNLYGFAGNNGVSAWDRLGLDNPSQPPNGKVNQGEVVPLAPVTVNATSDTKVGGGAALQSLGISTAVDGFGSNAAIATLSDNRSFTRQVDEIRDAERIKKRLLKTKGNISFEQAAAPVLYRFEMEELAPNSQATPNNADSLEEMVASFAGDLLGIAGHQLGWLFEGFIGRPLRAWHRESQNISDPFLRRLVEIAPDVAPLFFGVRLPRSASVAAAESRVGTEVVQRAMSRAELEATQSTGLLRGGREGTHYVSDAVNSTAGRAQQRLALPNTPEVRVTLEVPGGTFSPPTRVQPLELPGGRVLPGGGMERTATGQVPVRIIRVDGL